MKVLIFDLSNVCFDVGENEFLKELCILHNLDESHFFSYYKKYLVRAEKDEISSKELWEAMSKEFNISFNHDEIVEELAKRFIPKKNMIELIKKVRDKVRVAFLTNYCKGYWDKLSKKFNFDEFFDFGIVSYQVSVRKPDIKGFEVIKDKYNVELNDIIFVDDQVKNLQNAKDMGINVIHFKGYDDFVLKLGELGVV